MNMYGKQKSGKKTRNNPNMTGEIVMQMGIIDEENFETDQDKKFGSTYETLKEYIKVDNQINQFPSNI